MMLALLVATLFARVAFSARQPSDSDEEFQPLEWSCAQEHPWFRILALAGPPAPSPVGEDEEETVLDTVSDPDLDDCSTAWIEIGGPPALSPECRSDAASKAVFDFRHDDFLTAWMKIRAEATRRLLPASAGSSVSASGTVYYGLPQAHGAQQVHSQPAEVVDFWKYRQVRIYFAHYFVTDRVPMKQALAILKSVLPSTKGSGADVCLHRVKELHEKFDLTRASLSRARPDLLHRHLTDPIILDLLFRAHGATSARFIASCIDAAVHEGNKVLFQYIVNRPELLVIDGKNILLERAPVLALDPEIGDRSFSETVLEYLEHAKVPTVPPPHGLSNDEHRSETLDSLIDIFTSRDTHVELSVVGRVEAVLRVILSRWIRHSTLLLTFTSVPLPTQGLFTALVSRALEAFLYLQKFIIRHSVTSLPLHSKPTVIRITDETSGPSLSLFSGYEALSDAQWRGLTITSIQDETLDLTRATVIEALSEALSSLELDYDYKFAPLVGRLVGVAIRRRWSLDDDFYDGVVCIFSTYLAALEAARDVLGLGFVDQKAILEALKNPPLVPPDFLELSCILVNIAHHDDAMSAAAKRLFECSDDSKPQAEADSRELLSSTYKAANSNALLSAAQSCTTQAQPQAMATSKGRLSASAPVYEPQSPTSHIPLPSVSHHYSLAQPHAPMVQQPQRVLEILPLPVAYPMRLSVYPQPNSYPAVVTVQPRQPLNPLQQAHLALNHPGESAAIPINPLPAERSARLPVPLARPQPHQHFPMDRSLLTADRRPPAPLIVPTTHAFAQTPQPLSRPVSGSADLGAQAGGQDQTGGGKRALHHRGANQANN